MSNIRPELEVLRYMAEAEPGHSAGLDEIRAAAFIGRGVGQMLEGQTLRMGTIKELEAAHASLLGQKLLEELTPDDGIDARSFNLGVLLALEYAGEAFLLARHPELFHAQPA